jgi:hypothetical protein
MGLLCRGHVTPAALRNNTHWRQPPVAGLFLVPDQNDSRFVETGFPSLQWEDDDLPTRPMPLHERPLQARIDHEMAIIAERHIRIALAIEKFWGHRDCVEYLQKLIMSGGHQDGQNRVGFKPDVVSALMNLAALHQIE